ncbi:MAG: hypothetical protein U0992_05260 [Planctomycetaceae bacterium]
MCRLARFLIHCTAIQGADAPRKASERILNALNATEWIYSLDSAQIDATIRVTRPPETVELNKKRFVKELRDIGVEVTDEIPENVARERENFKSASTSTLTLAWDRKRLAYRFDSPDCLRDIAVWNGLQGRGSAENGVPAKTDSRCFRNHRTRSTVSSVRLPWAQTASHFLRPAGRCECRSAIGGTACPGPERRDPIWNAAQLRHV